MKFFPRFYYHVAFWAFFTLFHFSGAIIYKESITWKEFLLPWFVTTAILMGLVYTNFYLLLPVALKRKKYVVYAVVLLATIFLFSAAESYWDAYYHNIILASEKKETAQSELFGNFAFFLTFLFISVACKLSLEWYRERARLEKMKMEQLQTEIQFLKAQMNPHFLFNTLNNIYSLSLKKSDLTPQLILKLSEMLDYMIYESNEETVPLKNEISCIDNYIDLERIRQGNNATIEFIKHGDADRLQIAPLILLPFVENAFKHGVHESVSNAFIRIRTQISASSLELEIENNLKELKEPPNGKNGVGLKNVLRRLQLIYNGKHHYMVVEQNGTYKMNLKLNLS